MATERRNVAARLAVIVAVGIGWYALHAQNPPAAKLLGASAKVFSARRAMEHVNRIASEPHPMGSHEAEKVCVYLLEVMKGLGLNPELQRFEAAKIEGTNILARLEGTGPPGKKALLVCAHYDSTPRGPGAGDNASGVASVLESLRALGTGPKLERDLIVLIDDGEEVGLYGAEAFVKDHAWAKDVGVVINLDARGNSGPSVMFETSEGNGWLIAEYAKAAPHPLAASLSMDVYRLMPNDTNMTIFKRAGMNGLNFAFVGGLSVYHTPADTPVNLDPRTLQHQGENALAMIRHFGALDLDSPVQPNVIYTTLLNRVLVSYPTRFAMPLALFATALYLVVVVIGLVRSRMGLADLLAGVLAWFAGIFVAFLAVSVLSIAIRENLSQLGVPQIDLAYDVAILTVHAALAAFLLLAVERRALYRWSRMGLSVGAMAWWVAASLASARWLQGGSYLFVFPTIGCLLGLLVQVLAKPGANLAVAANLLGSLPLLVLFLPMIESLFEAMSVRMTGPLMIPVMLFVGAVLPILGPLVLEGRRDSSPEAPRTKADQES